MLIDCPRCGGETGCLCQWCNGNGCSFCRHTGQNACPTCEGEGTVDSRQFRDWCAGQTSAAIVEAIDRIANTCDALDAVNAYLDAAIDWMAEEDAERAKQLIGGDEQWRNRNTMR